MNKYILTLVTALIVLASCDDDTATLGVDMMPAADLITKQYETYDVPTRSYAVGDSVLARTSISYLGRFTDPETGTTVKSDFLAQFHCDEGFELPDSIQNDSCISFELRLFIDDYVGDSLAAFKLSVYELNKQLDPTRDYYTNINPEDYYDKSAEPLATKWFTISDRTITDSARWATSYNNNIRVTLPTELGTKIIRDYRKKPDHFANTSAWTSSNNPCSKGLYFKLEQGDGAMAYIYVVQMNIYFRYYDTDFEKDTVGLAELAATEEVVEATRVENSNLDKLLNDTLSTYLKCPAGIFTQATIPADQINVGDTINSAKLTFTRYNDLVQSSFKLSIPKTILLVRVDDYNNGFFENYQVADSVSSYITTFNSSTNSYTFNNIAQLVTKMAKEKENGSNSPNWNKVLLIPVEPSYSNASSIYSQQQLVKLNHDFSMSSARLVGGAGGNASMEVIYSRFKQ